MHVRVELTGTSPLLMHNVQLADPDNEFAKAIAAVTSKRKKTEEDRISISHLEFLGGLYVGQAGIVLPTQNFRKSLIEAGKVNKLGKTVQRAVHMYGLESALKFDGPRDPEQLWQAGKFTHRAPAKVGTSTVVRTRPVFTEWSVEFDAEVLTEVLDIDTFVELTARAGVVEGIGDGRSMGFGRYGAVVKTVN